jgi:hypothetical protein
VASLLIMGGAQMARADTTLSGNVSRASLTVAAGETLEFDPNQDTTLTLTGNLIVQGTLRMRPANPGIEHIIRFANVNEAAFVGGGMDPVASDIGLWVVGAGRLDAVGSARSGWLRSRGAIQAGATSLTLASAPTGWQVGDEITISPTGPPGARDFSTTFDTVRISSINGSTVGIDGVVRAHPMVDGQWTAEVANLTRNVRIEGTPRHRSHIFLRSTRPQSITYVAVRHVGPRQGNGFVQGRYGLHFHMSGDGSRGSQVVGTVIRDAGSHAFVPHMSHGVSFQDTIAFNTVEDAYWWDGAPDTMTTGSETNDILYDHVLAALVKAGSSAQSAPRLTGFNLGGGVGNIVRNSAAVGVAGLDWGGQASGFGWPEGNEGVWTFHDNISHNNIGSGAFVWQVTPREHENDRFTAYHNGRFGVYQGAYGANYHWRDAVLYGNGEAGGFSWAVASNTDERPLPPAVTQRWDGVRFDGAGISRYGLILAGRAIPDPRRAGVIANSVFTRYTAAAVKFTFDFHDYGPRRAQWRLENNTWTGGVEQDFLLDNTIHPASVLTVVDNRHGTIELRRADQCGPDRWGGCVTTIAAPGPTPTPRPTATPTPTRTATPTPTPACSSSIGCFPAPVEHRH